MRLFVKLSITLAAVAVTACAQGGGTGVDADVFEGTGGFDGVETPQTGWPFDLEQCGAAVTGKRVAGSMLVVLDRSGSMAYRWLETRGAVVQMMGNANPELELGLLPFPALGCDYEPLTSCLDDPDGAGCAQTLASGCCTDVAATPPVPLAPALAARDAAWAWFQGEPVDGYTPTLAALTSAYDYMKAQDVEGQRYVVLFTDGFPTVHGNDFGVEAFEACGEEGDIIEAVTEAAAGETSIKTFAIGAPGSEIATDLLGEIAIQGGTARTSPCDTSLGECHYTIAEDDFGAKLQGVLDTIAGLVGDCTFDIPEGNEDADPSLVNVGIDEPAGITPVYRDASHASGWDFADAARTQIQLYGEACSLYNARPSNEVVIVLGCEALVK